MINNPIVYKDSIRDLVDAFSSSKAKSHEAWDDAVFAPVRKAIKDHYLNEQDYTCPFCRQRYKVRHNRAWDAEHIIPKYNYPQFLFEPRNLCACCPDCNILKGNTNVLVMKKRRTFPKTSRAYLIVHPHFDNYDDHIIVVKPGTFYQYLTEKGRFTKIAYRLDRFFEDAGRNQVINRHPRLKNMAMSLICAKDDDELESYSKEMLTYIILKNKDKLGAETAVNVLDCIYK